MRHRQPVSLPDLVALHERGALTDEEFTAAKRVLLGL
nr:SHOCT domain-containing protein [Planctomonas sp. JC2975]